MTGDDNLLVTLFSGDYTEAVFLQSLLQAGGIEVTFETPIKSLPRILVPRRDVEAAREFIDDFLKNGRRTT